MSPRILLLGILWCIAGLSLADLKTNTHEYRLDNGLKIIVREDHRAPLIISQVWYKVGGSYEQGGSTGLSHALEHMMFRGTPRYPDGQFSKIIAEHGGEQNAFTSQDYTVYYQLLNTQHLNVCFSLEADRMQNLTLAEDTFSKELKVIQEERRLRTDDNPEAAAQERFFAASFLNNPKQNPVIGWMGDINEITVKDLRNWYHTWYAPNNAILVIVGDVNPEDVFSMAKTHFSHIKPKVIPKLKLRQDPPYLGEKRIRIQLPNSQPYLLMGYNVPAVTNAQESWEPYALQVLLMTLDGGESSRFSENLLRQNTIAASIRSGYNPFTLFSTQITFFGTPAERRSLDDLEKAFLKEINRLHKEPLKEAELKRIKAIIAAAHIFEKDSLAAQARSIGSLEAIGLSWTLEDSYIERIESVTAEQVQQVARKYLIPERLTVAYLIPKLLEKQP